MPHQCVKCGSLYEDGSSEILSGCTSCKGKLFFFIKKDRMDEIKSFSATLTNDDKARIENDVFDIIGISKDAQTPVVLDFESIKVLRPGQYELDIVNLLKDNPLVYKLEDGKYMIDLPESLKKSFKQP